MNTGLGRAILVALGIGVVVAALARVPLHPGDELRGTLLIAPIIAVGFWMVRSNLHSRGVWVDRQPPLLLDAAVLIVLMLLVPARSQMGLLGAPAVLDRIVALGFLLLLYGHLLRYLPALQRLKQASSPGRPSPIFIVLPLLVYVAILPWSSAHRAPDGDEPYYLLITHSLVHDFDTELSNNYENQDSLLYMHRAIKPEWVDPRGPNGEVYSRHTMLLPLVLAPAYRIAGSWGAMLTMILLTSCVGWLMLRLAGRYWPEHHRGAVYAWALLVFTPPWILYSHQIWVEVPAALLLLLGIDSIHSLAAEKRSRSWVLLVASVLLLPLLKLRFVLLAVPLIALSWWRVPRARRALAALALLFVLVAAGVLAYNQITYGNALKDHSVEQLQRIQSRSPLLYARGGFGLLWDNAFGLFAANPTWLLLVPAVALTAWKRESIGLDLAVCLAVYLAVVSPRMEWYGAWAPPFRLGLALLPLAALTLVPLLERQLGQGARALAAALGGLGVAVSSLLIAMPAWTYNLADGGSHVLDRLTLRLGADVLRFFPSFVRPSTATWVWPVVTIVLCLTLWRWPTRGRQASLWGATLLLTAVALLPWASVRFPTRVVEIEDLHVVKQGGQLYPEAWVPGRPRYRGGWSLRSGDSLTAPVVGGGTAASITIDWRSMGPRDSTVELSVAAAGGTPVAWTAQAPSSWTDSTLQIDAWPAGQPLEIRVLETEAGASRARIIIDRATIEWR